MTHLPKNPDQLVFSGGGLRCFWQGGVMSVLDDRQPIRPARVTGVSGGALAGAAWLAGLKTRLLDEMCAAFEQRDSNIDLFAADENGITPHQELYCSVVEAVIDDRAAEKIAQGPAFQIMIAHPPEKGHSTFTGTALTVAYEAELHSVGSPHFSWAEKLGLQAKLVNANQAAREGKLVELVTAAAVIPPVFEPPLWEERAVVDGGMADQAPMPEPDKGETLILLTREYKNIPDIPGRFYVHPSKETPADKIDFTDPGKLRKTWDLGERDAEAWLDAADGDR